LRKCELIGEYGHNKVEKDLTAKAWTAVPNGGDLDNDGMMEKMIMRFQLEAAQQSIIQLDAELERLKAANANLQRLLDEREKEAKAKEEKQKEEEAKTKAREKKEMRKRAVALQTLERRVEEIEKKAKAVEEEVTRQSARRACCECGENDRDTILLPCLHLLFCHLCADRLITGVRLSLLSLF
jgi:DNA repair exonuclease SbcCD ATPase subunit